MTPLEQIKEVFRKGKEEDRWKGLAQCARKLRMKRTTLQSQLCGDVTDDDVLKTTIGRMEKVMQQKRGEKPQWHPLLQTLHELFAEGKRQKVWIGCKTCQGKVGINHNTLRSQLLVRKTELDIRLERTIRRTIRKMRAALPRAPSKPGPVEPAAPQRDSKSLVERFVQETQQPKIRRPVKRKVLLKIRQKIQSLRQSLEWLTRNDSEAIRAEAAQVLGPELRLLVISIQRSTEVTPTDVVTYLQSLEAAGFTL